MPLFLKAFVIGLSIAAPVGPIGVLCIRRTLVFGRRAGFVSGLGAATADAFYGAVAAFGLTVLFRFFVQNARPLHLAGGAALLLLGLHTMLARRVAAVPEGNAARLGGLLPAYASTLFLTITNPMTILSFAAVFAVIAPAGGLDYGAAAVTVAGVFTGSAAWWLILSLGVGAVRQAAGAPLLAWVSRFSGGVIAAFGAAQLVEPT
ncbi:MAG TPA: LysE family transporter [bacterium]|nr:LysE family transporter [bacterium]